MLLAQFLGGDIRLALVGPDALMGVLQPVGMQAEASQEGAPGLLRVPPSRACVRGQRRKARPPPTRARLPMTPPSGNDARAVLAEHGNTLAHGCSGSSVSP
jgi:hypothetical protein